MLLGSVTGRNVAGKMFTWRAAGTRKVVTERFGASLYHPIITVGSWLSLNTRTAWLGPSRGTADIGEGWGPVWELRTLLSVDGSAWLPYCRDGVHLLTEGRSGRVRGADNKVS